MLEKILKSFLWDKQGGVKGIHPMAWGICTLPRDQGRLCILNIRAQGASLAFHLSCYSNGVINRYKQLHYYLQNGISILLEDIHMYLNKL